MPNLITKEEFESLADGVIRSCTFPYISVSLRDTQRNTTRFANNEPTQNLESHGQEVFLSVAKGACQGKAQTTDLSSQGLHQALQMAESQSFEIPHPLPPLGPQNYLSYPTFCPQISQAGPQWRAQRVQQVGTLCQEQGARGAGVVETFLAARGVKTNSGLVAYGQESRARFSLTVVLPDSTGKASWAHRSAQNLDVPRETRQAIDRARRSGRPKQLPPGRYRVILSPSAMASFVAPLFWALDGRSYHRGASPVARKLHQRIVDSRLTFENRPDHPDLLGLPFNAEGLPINCAPWIEKGKLCQLFYDQLEAQKQGVSPVPFPRSLVISGEDPVSEGLDGLIQSTQRGIFVAHLWYIRFCNFSDLTITGMTRDGVFLIEDGKITSALRNFRFHDSPLRALNALSGWGRPQEAISYDADDKMMAPAVAIEDFPFTSVTAF